MSVNPKLNMLPILAFLFAFVAACRGTFPDSGGDLAATIDAQNARLAALNTQVASQGETIQSQWNAISYLATQMPIALELITPIPQGVTLTPTPWITPTPTSTPTPFINDTPTPYIDIEYPPDTRTGIAEIDRVIDAFLLQAVDDRVALVRFIQYPCTTADGLGGPPKCEGDETDGTLVEAFPVLFSEGFHVRPENIQASFDFTVRGLFAVYPVPESAYDVDYFPAGEHAVVFTTEEDGFPHSVIVHVTEGQIVRLEFILGWPPFDQILERSETFILPPSTR